MKLSELRLSDLALFRSRHVTFAPGVNLVSGSNSRGKTVLLKALRCLFSGQLDHSLACQECTSSPAVAVRFDHAGVEKLVEQVFDNDGAEIPPELTDFPAELMKRGCFVLEGGLTALPGDQLGSALRRLCLAKELDDSLIIDALQAEYRLLTAHNPWGDDRHAAGELEQIRERLAEIEREWDERLESLKQLGTLRQREKKQASEEDSERLSDKPVQPASVEAVPETVSPADDDDSFGDFVEESIALEPASWTDDEVDDLAHKDPRQTRERLWQVQKEAAALRQELVSVPELSTLLPVVLTLLFLLLGGALAMIYRELWQAVAMAGGGLIVFTWAVFVFLSRNKGSELNRLRENLSRVEGEREILLQDLDRLDEQRRYGSANDFNDEADDDSDAPAVSAESLVEQVEESDEVSQEMAQSEEIAPQESLWQQKRRLLAEVSDLRALEMEGEVLRFREQEISYRIKVLTTAIEMLFQSEDRVSGKRRIQLGETLNRYVGDLLPGVELAVSVSKNWKLEILRGGSDQPSPFSSLSRGEQRLVTLALHMALLELSGELGLPLLVDDLFDEFDPSRRDGVSKVLEDFSLRHQVVFSSREPDMLTRALSRGWHVISLDDGPHTTKPKPKQKPTAEERSDDEQQLHLL